MRLVKDIKNGRIVLYWMAGTGKQISTLLHSMQEAEEWWKAYMFSKYEGEERRRSILDRRSNFEKRRRLERMTPLQSCSIYGRRVTDIPVRVSSDLVPEKIKAMQGV